MTLVCDDDIQARINAPLLEQAIVNLIDNAVKYSEPGAAVEIRVEQQEGQTTISVKDTGCGIPAEHLSRIFERFYVVDKSRSRKLGGTGLGLAIVKHIAQVHGGHVTVESTPGKGSTFTLHLPPPDDSGTSRRPRGGLNPVPHHRVLSFRLSRSPLWSRPH